MLCRVPQASLFLYLPLDRPRDSHGHDSRLPPNTSFALLHNAVYQNGFYRLSLFMQRQLGLPASAVSMLWPSCLASQSLRHRQQTSPLNRLQTKRGMPSLHRID